MIFEIPDPKPSLAIHAGLENRPRSLASMSEVFASVNTKISVPEVMNRSAMAPQPTKTLAKQYSESNGAEFIAPEFDDAKTIGAQSKVVEITETTELDTHRSRSIGSITTVGKLRLGSRRDGVDHAASYIAFSPDGKTLVTAARDSMILYTIGSPTEKIRFETMRWPRNGKDVHTIFFSPDRKFSCFWLPKPGSGFQYIYLWQITHLIQRRLAGSRSIFREHTKLLCSSPDGTLLARGDSAGKILVWRLDDLGSPVYQRHCEKILGITFKPNGDLLIIDSTGIHTQSFYIELFP